MDKPDLCKGCPLYLEGEGFAPPEGSTESSIWLIGEALGEDEARLSKPFVGGAGRVLNALLFSASIYRSDCYVTNVVKCRPVTPVGKNRTPNPGEVLACTSRYLNAELKQVPVNTTIVPLGNIPLKAIVNKDGITKWRGSTFNLNNRRVIPTIHPAGIMRQQELWSTVVFDLKKAANPTLSDPPILFLGQPSYEKAMAWLLNQSLEEMVVVDVETSIDSMYDLALVCVGFCNGKEAICIPWLHQGGKEYWPPSLQAPILEAINRLLQSPNLVYQNSPFDIRVLKHLGFDINLQPTFDTMLAHHLMFAELPHKLEFITSIYTNIPYYKDDIKEGSDSKAVRMLNKDDVTWNYNCLDTSGTYISAQRLAEELEESHLKGFFNDRTMPMVPVVISMMDLGIKVDLAKAKAMSRDFESYLNLQDQKVNQVAGREINPLSPTQLVKYFFEEKGYKILKRTEKGAPSCDEQVLERLFSQYGSQLAYEVIQYRKAAKLKSTYLDIEGQLGPDGRLHTNLLLHGTATGRLSSREPNLQNVPKAIREIYIPEEGKKFYQFDYSQIEVRIISYLCSDEDWIATFLDPSRDLHAENASLLFNRSVNECGKGTIFRDAAKTFLYGIILYGGGPYSFMAAWPGLFHNVRIVEIAQERLLSAHPKLKAYREAIKCQIQSTRLLINTFGRPRRFFGFESTILKAGYNFPVQSAAADIINPVMIRLYNLKVPGMLLQVHDSILFEWSEEETKTWCTIVKAEMERPITVGKHTITIPVDIAFGSNWKEAS